jgi:CheY-like chemotaxis protein
MLAYAGKTSLEMRPVLIGSLVEELTGLLRLSVSKCAELRLDLQRDVPPVIADPAQITQVIMNLVINASEAIGDRRGVITVKTHLATVTKDEIRRMQQAVDLLPGRYVALEVSDDGCGMDKETVRRIFEPFFSTKFAGRGLGLAAVIGIVRAHRGGLSVTSEPGCGSKFRVLLAPAQTGASEEPGRPLAPDSWRGSGTILVIDDEDLVLDVTRSMLDVLGFRVILASSGTEGLAMFSSRQSEIRAVILDMTMPDMNGAEVLRTIRGIRSDVPVLLISGYSEDDLGSILDTNHADGFVRKPFSVATITAKLKSVLGD